jgi:hypothetical protein
VCGHMMPPFHPFHQFQGTHVEERRIHKGFGRTHLCAVVVVLFFIRVLTLGDRPASSGFRFVDTSPSFTCKKVCTCYVWYVYTSVCDMFVCLQCDDLFFNIAGRSEALQSLSKHSNVGHFMSSPKKNKSKVKSQWWPSPWQNRTI